jgi:putative FmdB family regulatory protein
MPTYEYACRSCGEHLEVVQSFREDPLTTCPACGGDLRKVFGSIGVVFKGSGFYKNDSRPAAKESSSAKEPSTATASDSAATSDKVKDGAATAKEKTSSDSSSGSGSSDKGPSPKAGSSSEKSSPSSGKSSAAAS